MKYNDNGLWKTLNVKVTDTLPVGTIIPYAGTTIPSNYMKCEGQELSRIEYDILFSAIGTTYGAGDGTTTFNLPNLKGRVITGIDSNDTDFDVLGETGGEKTHTLTIDEMPSHNHRQTYYLDKLTLGSSDSAIMSGGSGVTDGNSNQYTTNAGGDQPHNNLQPYIVLNYIIKVLDAPATQAQVFNEYSTSSRDSYSCNYMNSINKCSTDEIRTNKIWVDNKPIYRKAFYFTQWSALGVDTGLENIDNIINANVMLKNTATGQWMKLANNSDGNYGFYIKKTGNTYKIFVLNNSVYTADAVCAFVEYTKTTD